MKAQMAYVTLENGRKFYLGYVYTDGDVSTHKIKRTKKCKHATSHMLGDIILPDGTLLLYIKVVEKKTGILKAYFFNSEEWLQEETKGEEFELKEAPEGFFSFSKEFISRVVNI